MMELFLWKWVTLRITTIEFATVSSMPIVVQIFIHSSPTSEQNIPDLKPLGGKMHSDTGSLVCKLTARGNIVSDHGVWTWGPCLSLCIRSKVLEGIYSRYGCDLK